MTDFSSIVTRLETSVACLERRLSSQDEEVLISCLEADRLLGKTPPTVSKMIKDGRLHKTTIGESTGIRLSEIRKINAQ